MLENPWQLGVDQKLNAILSHLAYLTTLITNLGGTIVADLTALTNQVAQNTTVEQSAITLIQGLAGQIQAAGTDQTKLNQLVSTLQTSAANLAAAITANTPAAPTTPPTAGT